MNRRFKSRLFSLAPILIMVPYVGYVMSDRFDDHNQRRKVLDEERKKLKEKTEATDAK